MSDLPSRLAARIRDEGSISYSTFVDAALYDADAGFYAAGGSAGRRGDFLTSVEVGPLFGAVVAKALDVWWDELGRPARFRVVESGAGRGTLARTVMAAAPECAPALDYVLVERSERLRSEHPTGPAFRSSPHMPDDPAVGVVLANELLDNFAFDLLEWRDGSWHEVRVGLAPAAPGGAETGGPIGPSFVEELVPFRGGITSLPVDVADGARVPVQRQAVEWLRAALALVSRGRVVVIDYADTTHELAKRPWRDWLRTYRGHERGGPPLEAPGSQDITCEVAVDQLAAERIPDRDRSQAEFLVAHGIDELVNEGRRIWHERAHVADLAAMRARSRVREAEALLDQSGLGAFRVLEWDVDTTAPATPRP